MEGEFSREQVKHPIYTLTEYKHKSLGLLISINLSFAKKALFIVRYRRSN